MKFPGSSNEAVDLLKKLLAFNPYYRATLDEALSHPFLASVRVPEREDQDISELKFDFEDEGDLSEVRL